MSDQIRRSYSHLIRKRYCKGCGICAAFCPKKVLAIKDGKVFAEKPELCIGCRMCELRCPDFAIEVHEADLAQEAAAGADSMDFNLPPEAMHD